ncbi:MAG: hypothetical protein E7137_06225 [Rikenellaceae bacterium]|nr:hypothetical protein [Rikenellaceae bacterium]
MEQQHIEYAGPKGGWARLAHLLSTLLHPFFVPLYALLVLLSGSLLLTSTKLYLVGVILLYTFALPTFMLLLLRHLGHLSGYRIDNRRERILPLMLGTLSYLLCALTLLKLPVAMLLHKMMFGAALCQLFCLLVTLRWKISLHLTAQGGLVAFFSILTIAGNGRMLLPLLFSVLCSGLLSSARLYLGCHNGWQVLAGFMSGFLIMFLTVLLL